MEEPGMEPSRIGFGRRLDVPFAAAVDSVRAALKAQGFGVITEIDVRKTMKEKLGAEFNDYVILGACNPTLAHQALSADPEVGLLLPCNVVVYADGAGSVVRALDPEAALGVAGIAALAPVAAEAKRRLEAMVASLG